MNLINFNITGYVFTVFAVIAIYFVINKRLSDISRKVNETMQKVNTLITTTQAQGNLSSEKCERKNIVLSREFENAVNGIQMESINQDDNLSDDLNDELDDDVDELGDDVNELDNNVDELDDDVDELDDDDDLEEVDIDVNVNIDELDDDLNEDNNALSDNSNELLIETTQDDDLNELGAVGTSTNLLTDLLNANPSEQESISDNTKAVVLDSVVAQEPTTIVLEDITLDTIKDIQYSKFNVADLRTVIKQLNLNEEDKKLKKKEMVALIDEATASK